MITAADILIELQKDSFTETEQDFIEKKITYYTTRAEKIAPESPEEIKNEYITAAVIKDYKTADDISSFSDGRFTLNIDKEEIIQRYKRALQKLYGIKIWKP
ncbi:MAG: hypothetical protein H5T45_06040 [Thermoplasmatales archaeon]|nr:hypothetical protein [Thermoplasmatales archaeon]